MDKSYRSYVLHVIWWCFIFQWSFMKISFKLQSGHDCLTDWQTDGQTTGKNNMSPPLSGEDIKIVRLAEDKQFPLGTGTSYIILTHLHQVDTSTTTVWTCLFPTAGYLISFYYYNVLCFIEIPVFNANSVDPDQMPHSVTSDLGLHCFFFVFFVLFVFLGFFCQLPFWVFLD